MYILLLWLTRKIGRCIHLTGTITHGEGGFNTTIERRNVQLQLILHLRCVYHFTVWYFRLPFGYRTAITINRYVPIHYIIDSLPFSSFSIKETVAMAATKTQISLAAPVCTSLGIEDYKSRYEDEKGRRCYILFSPKRSSWNDAEWIRAPEVQENEGLPDVCQGQVQPIEHYGSI